MDADEETPAAKVTTPLLSSSAVLSPASSPSQEDLYDGSFNDNNVDRRDIDSRDAQEENHTMSPPKRKNIHRLSHPNRKHVSHTNEGNARAVSFAPEVKELVACINRDNYAGVVSLLELDPNMANALDEVSATS